MALPERLNIARVEFQPSVLRSRAPFTGRFRIMDTRGYAVRDALVYVVGVPFSPGEHAARGEDRRQRLGDDPVHSRPRA